MLEEKELQTIVASYRNCDLKRSLWQLGNSFILYSLCWYFMYLSLTVTYWLTLALAFPAAGLMIRLFIIFHDCGHGSFFKSANANNFWGMVSGFFVFTPYYQWRHEHAIHHATSGNLDKVGVGSIWTLTVAEYSSAPGWTRFKYRVYRNPLVFFTISSWINFLFIHRFTFHYSNKKDRQSVHLTTITVVGIALLLSLLIGLKQYLLIQLPILMIASSAGVWLFYLQHQYEGVYWERQEKWNRIDAALKGSSFYKLPKVLQWFTGNIGYHHIHHVSPSIPNYYLEKCYQENPVFQEVKPTTFLSGFKSLSLRLYDEASHRLVGYPAQSKKPPAAGGKQEGR